MAYMGELGAGSSIYIDNQNSQTIVTSIASSPGQQQQASHSFTTGHWTTSPELFRSPQGAIIKLGTAQGNYYLQVQGNRIVQTATIPPQQILESIPLQQVVQPPTTPIPPMPPMPSLEMDNLFMNVQPMQMRMGNMHMSVGTASTATYTTKGNFCSQCGAATAAADKFCANCGHRLH
ncbi:zinc ribbon domain-containing protein [Acaryochloris sp. IP29b_bin.148]|uniref:zinc ribbon domain-containing protein n=1 Tax=Acaryochloris sp. IP29b_bin.148 TaxID=2969218 RepID=UPI0026187131|nr:zinc ribbon domain-containing protein [Acaryochloris sp. IP29b_bin.148]